ncbi:NUDIX hydrolase [Neptunomonas concharum]|uniref:NUDIX hydrolase n=1 Tax=Neptunomonas concharum TaxID=1031538 RepID=UPI00147693A9|nr:NUDIX domain-containing protein [Neptunomonas concharum]
MKKRLNSTKSFVVGFLFNPSLTHVVLIEKNKPLWQKGRLNGLGGLVNDGESISNAISREVFEESGVMLPPQLWSQFHKTTNKDDKIVHYFFAVSSLANKAKSNEKEKVSLVSINQLPSNCLHDIKKLIMLAMGRMDCTSI